MENVRIITFSTCQMHQKGIFPGPTISCDKLNIWNISTHFICVRLLTKNRLYTVIPLGGTILSESCFEIKAVLPIFMSKFLVTEDGRLLFIISHIFLITLISYPPFWFPANLALALPSYSGDILTNCSLLLHAPKNSRAIRLHRKMCCLIMKISMKDQSFPTSYISEGWGLGAHL